MLRFAAMVASLTLGLLSGTANASFLYNIKEVGSDVVVTGSGSIDLTGFASIGTGSHVSDILPSEPAIVTGAGIGQDLYRGGIISGPATFGPGNTLMLGNGSGMNFGFDVGIYNQFEVPAGYVSGDFISSNATFVDSTFASIGLTPGIYIYNVGEVIGNTITLDIGNSSMPIAAMPLPASAPMFGAALLALGAVGYGMKRKSATSAA